LRSIGVRRGGLVASSARITLLLDAISDALAVIASVPASEETERITREAGSVRAIVESWHDNPPTPEAREAATLRVVSLHTAAAWLRRKSQPQVSNR
jgi:hypothetical protein